MIGKEMYQLATRLWPLNRSITGEGVRQTIKMLKEILPGLQKVEVKTGFKAFDWSIPKEWNVKQAFIITPSGKKICDFQKNNLHLLGYSVPFKGHLSLKKLQKHLYSIPNIKNAIPYRTSYYQRRWGFCLEDKKRKKLKNGNYKVVVDTCLSNGTLTYADLLISGRSSKEILLSTWICHPSLANNELSGIVVSTYLAKWLQTKKKLNYTYRFVFVPETIGSLVYLRKNLTILKKNVIAGFCLSCLGDNRGYSYLTSRQGNTLSDKAAVHVMRWIDPKFKIYDWNHRGGDERQYCAPGINLPIASVMRTKYGEYREYHTSLDNLNRVVSPAGLFGGYLLVQKIIEALEMNCIPIATNLGEPFFSKYKLRKTLGGYKNISEEESNISNVLTWADGNHDLFDIANKIKKPIWDLYSSLELLINKKLVVIKKINE